MKGENRGISAVSLRLFGAATTAGSIGVILLLYFLMSHQFQYTYVARFSSLTQPVLYLVSALWAGQEGTFLLWAVLTGTMGIVFIKRSRIGDGYAMSAVSAFIAFLYLIMLVKSPFEMSATVPVDGTGMNPLLQSPWMAIHPPILFVGYAATIFPFALVLSGLIRRKYENWIEKGFAWTLFSATTLGAGIIIGGFWAYEVLGWGGYWGWDPVENASLVPWLTLLALIHGLLVQRVRGSLVRTNIFLAIGPFLLVLYATFLTRSGVLADFSVHSFVDLGINTYLITVMVISAAIGIGLFVSRFQDFKSPKIDFTRVSRELALLFSLYVILASALFTFIGMSSPILTGIFGKASQVDTSFYNKVNLPIGIGIALLLGITPFLGWTEEKKSGLLKQLTMPLVLTLLASAIAFVAGVRTPTLMLFVAAASFALISNSIITFRQYRSGWVKLGGPIAHIGIALMLIGIIGSGNFDDTKQVVLIQGEPKNVGGREFTFTGIDESQPIKPQVQIQVSDGKSSFVSTPKLYFSEANQAMMREPDITIFPLADLYLSPIEVKVGEDAHGHESIYELTKGETKEIAGYSVTFTRFDMNAHGQPGAMTVGAVLDVRVDGKATEIIPLLTFNGRGEREPIPADLPTLTAGTNGHDRPHIYLNAINVEQKKVALEIHGVGHESHASAPMQLILEVSTKPLMMVLWTGVVLIIIGSGLSWWRRALVPE